MSVKVVDSAIFTSIKSRNGFQIASNRAYKSIGGSATLIELKSLKFKLCLTDPEHRLAISFLIL